MAVAKVGGRGAKNRERGATAVEYAIIAAAIAGVVLAAAIDLGTQVHTWFSAAETEMQAAGAP